MEKIVEKIQPEEWRAIFKEINEEYQDQIKRQFSNNEELLKVLELSKINEAHFLKEEPGDINETLEIIYRILTENLRRILEKNYNIPEEVTEHMYITNIKIPLVKSRNFNPNCCNVSCCGSIYAKCC